jgi:hypothetical protein
MAKVKSEPAQVIEEAELTAHQRVDDGFVTEIVE